MEKILRDFYQQRFRDTPKVKKAILETLATNRSTPQTLSNEQRHSLSLMGLIAKALVDTVPPMTPEEWNEALEDFENAS